MLSEIQKANLKFKLVGLFQIRMIGFVGAKLVTYNENETVVRIPLNRRTRNHLGSMYFGALATGADVTGAWIAFDYLARTKAPVSIVFKDIQANFLKRADGDVYFTCTDGAEVVKAFKATMADGERKNIQLKVVATVPSKYQSEPVAEFTMTLSMRGKKK
ncbi:MAG: PaaI family thioesterase [Flavobacteriales bacterium]|nr:PaaI family thioesterase [Flavobacteriales bacterium]MCB9192158.1 PaaI family thioesterase [Flavobacteriales bacterium]MCB9203841.1 PaaI family thioesterase [Flavobacteriales bacterium]